MRRLLVLILVASLSAIGAQVTISVSATGYITDTMCGAKGANAQHVDCAKRSVASGNGSAALTTGAKYALYDEATKKLYILQGSGVGDQGSGTEGTNIGQYLG